MFKKKTLFSSLSFFHQRFIIGLAISVALLVVELAIFLVGPSLFRNQVTFISKLLEKKSREMTSFIFLATILHSAGAISLSFMIFTRWCSVFYWPVFAVCSCIPFFIEIINAIGYNLKHWSMILFSIWNEKNKNAFVRCTDPNLFVRALLSDESNCPMKNKDNCIFSFVFHPSFDRWWKRKCLDLNVEWHCVNEDY